MTQPEKQLEPYFRENGTAKEGCHPRECGDPEPAPECQSKSGVVY